MERNKSLFRPNQSSGTGNRPETFAFYVDSYDVTGKTHFVYGRRLDGGEKVKVTLRQNIDQKDAKFARAEIADFAAPRGNMLEPGTVADGILLAQEAFLNDDGVHAARWIQVLSHAPGEAEVFCATITVSSPRVGEKVDGGRKIVKHSAYMQLIHSGNFDNCSDAVKDMLKLTPPFEVEGTKELEEAITALLLDDLGVGVRVKGDAGFDGTYVKFDRKAFNEKKTEPERTEFAAAAAKEYIASIEPLAAQIDSGELVCEVIPYSTLWAGPKTAQAMATRANMQVRVNRFQETVQRPGKEPYHYSVYRPAIVAVRKTKPDTNGNSALYFSHFEPLNTMYPIRGISDTIAYAQTSVLAPEIPAPQSTAPAAAAAPAQAPANSTGAASGTPAGAKASEPSHAPSAAAGDHVAEPGAEAGPLGSFDAPDSGFPAETTGDDLMFGIGADAPASIQSIGDEVAESGASSSASAAAAPAPAPAPARRYTGRRAQA